MKMGRANVPKSLCKTCFGVMPNTQEIGYNTKVEGGVTPTTVDAGIELVSKEFPLADADGAGLLRH